MRRSKKILEDVMEESIKQAFHYNVKKTKLGKIEASKDQSNALK